MAMNKQLRIYCANLLTKIDRINEDIIRIGLEGMEERIKIEDEDEDMKREKEKMKR